MASHILQERHTQYPLLSLDQTLILVFPSSKSEVASKGIHEVDSQRLTRFVQVTIETSGSQGAPKVGKADTIAAFYIVQHEVSELIVSTITAHSTYPVPCPIKFVQQNGPVPYILLAENQPWPFGKTLGLIWGQERLVASDLKWIFKFTTLGEGKKTN